MTVLTMTDLIESAFRQTGLNTRHVIHPQGHLRTIKGSLLDDALGAVAQICQYDVIGLVSRITEEIALEDSLSVGQTVTQSVVGSHHSLQLLGVRQTWLADMNHSMIFLDFRAVVETVDIGTGVLKIEM